MGRVIQDGETLLASPAAGWVNSDGLMTKGELLLTDRRLVFLEQGWQRKQDWFAEFDLPWEQVESVSNYRVKRNVHVFVRSIAGPGLPADAWNPVPRPGRSVTWRFWLGRGQGEFLVRLGRVGLLEAEDNVWVRPS